MIAVSGCQDDNSAVIQQITNGENTAGDIGIELFWGSNSYVHSDPVLSVHCCFCRFRFISRGCNPLWLPFFHRAPAHYLIYVAWYAITTASVTAISKTPKTSRTHICRVKKNWHGLERARCRGIRAMRQQTYMIATVQNIKRLVGHLHRKFSNTGVTFCKTVVFYAPAALNRAFYNTMRNFLRHFRILAAVCQNSLFCIDHNLCVCHNAFRRMCFFHEIKVQYAVNAWNL